MRTLSFAVLATLMVVFSGPVTSGPVTYGSVNSGKDADTARSVTPSAVMTDLGGNG